MEKGQALLAQHMAWCSKMDGYSKTKWAGPKHQQGELQLVKNKISVGPEDLCPIHPMAGHTWGKCFLNVCNKDVKKNTTTTKVNKKKEKVQEADVMNVAPGNKHRINDNDSFISDGWLRSAALSKTPTSCRSPVMQQQQVRQRQLIHLKSIIALMNLSLIT
jgi:hypothetical protein